MTRQAEVQVERGAPCQADLGWSLTTLLRAYVRAADAVLADLPGGGRAYRMLIAVGQGDQPSQLALAETVGLDRTVVTYLLDGLVTAGLVERRADPADRRIRRIVLTDAGSTGLVEFGQRLAQVEQQVLGALGEDEVVVLRGLLQRAASGVRGLGATTCGDVERVGQSPCPSAC